MYTTRRSATGPKGASSTFYHSGDAIKVNSALLMVIRAATNALGDEIWADPGTAHKFLPHGGGSGSHPTPPTVRPGPSVSARDQPDDAPTSSVDLEANMANLVGQPSNYSGDPILPGAALTPDDDDSFMVYST